MIAVSGKKILSVAIASLFLTALNAQSVYSDQLQEQISITNARTLGPEAERIVSRSAAKVLRQIAEARTAINSKDIERARKDLMAVIMQINVIKTEMPSVKISDHISVAKQHLNYESTEEVMDDLVPIEASLVEISDYVSVEKAQQHIGRVRSHLKKGDKKGARQALDALYQEVIYTQIYLPLSSTEHFVISAQKALDNNNPERADKALKKAENGVEFLSEIVTEPGIRLHESMGQLIKNYAAKNYMALKNELNDIDGWIKKLSKSADSVTRDEANYIHSSLQNIGRKLEQSDKDYTKELKGIWHRSKALAERETEKSTIGWKQQRPTADIRADLIDAKQKVAFAENLEFYAMADPDDIFKALEEAKAILGKVAILGKMDDKAKKELNQAIKEIAMIHNNTPAPNHKNLYELVRARLRGLIHNRY